MFEGKILDDGGYKFEIREITPGFEENNLFEFPVIHTFYFSSDFNFQEYKVRKHPGAFSPYKGGFTVSANFICVFDEPMPDPHGKGRLTAHLIDLSAENYNYRKLKHPDYYRGLCELATEPVA